MRFPSLQSLAGGAWQTFRRFPIAILLAALATGLGIWWTHLKSIPQSYSGAGWQRTIIEVPRWYWNAIVSCYLGMLLSVAVSKWVEKRGVGRGEGMVEGGRGLGAEGEGGGGGGGGVGGGGAGVGGGGCWWRARDARDGDRVTGSRWGAGR